MLHRSVIAGKQDCLFAYEAKVAGALKSLSGLNFCIMGK